MYKRLQDEVNYMHMCNYIYIDIWIYNILYIWWRVCIVACALKFLQSFDDFGQILTLKWRGSVRLGHFFSAYFPVVILIWSQPVTHRVIRLLLELPSDCCWWMHLNYSPLVFLLQILNEWMNEWTWQMCMKCVASSCWLHQSVNGAQDIVHKLEATHSSLVKFRGLGSLQFFQQNLWLGQ